jgi:hypothetical protein
MCLETCFTGIWALANYEVPLHLAQRGDGALDVLIQRGGKQLCGFVVCTLDVSMHLKAQGSAYTVRRGVPKPPAHSARKSPSGVLWHVWKSSSEKL